MLPGRKLRDFYWNRTDRAFLNASGWQIPGSAVKILSRGIMKTKTAVFTLILVIVFGVSAFAQDSATQFKRMCALCHGADGKSNTAMGKSLKSADLTSQAVQSLRDAELYNVIAHGKGKMAAYEGILGKQGAESMVKYVRTLKQK